MTRASSKNLHVWQSKQILTKIPQRFTLIGYIIFSVAYGAVLASLPDASFKDFNSYLNYAENGDKILERYVSRGSLSFAFNEPVWLITNISFSFFLSSEAVVRSVIFISMSVMAFVLLKNNPQHAIWIFLILIHPQIIKNGLVHLRQGLAIAIFLVGYYTVAPKRRIFLMALSPFIHSSFFLILMIQFIPNFIRKINFSARLAIILFSAVGIIIGSLIPVISSLLNARQGLAYSETAINGSGLGFVMWFIILAIFLMEKRDFIHKYFFEINLVTFYLAIYWVFAPSMRVFESGLALVLIAGLYLVGIKRYLFLGTIGVSMAFMWYQRLGQPSLGFAGVLE